MITGTADGKLREIDVGTLLEERRLGAFQLQVLLLGVLILFVDGLDFSASNVGAPAIARAFGVDRSAVSVVLSSGFFGILVGSFAFGYLGDQIGRRWGAILGVLIYSVPGLFSVFAHSLGALAVLRFLTGLGMGGVVPNVIAFLTETAPKRYRVTFVMLGYVGYSLGNAAIAQVAAWFIPNYGWSVVFEVAGAVGLVLSVALLIWLPESLPYLAAKQPDDPRLPVLVARLAPEVEKDTRFVLRRPASEARFTLKLLFDGYRRIATPLLWLGFFSESLTYMTLAAWFSVILEEAGLVPTRASFVFSYAYLGAMAAIVILARLIDRFGPRAALISAAIAAVALVYLGTPGLSPVAITVIAIVALAFSSATHQSLNGIVGGFYPTVVRGNGVGYASGMGRAAAIIGPLIAGSLLAAKLPLQTVLASIAAPYLVVVIVCLGLDRLQRRMMSQPHSAALPDAAIIQPALSPPV
jgi:AAHS family 4-hydroxybenzoate transporter-like MFS transporter